MNRDIERVRELLTFADPARDVDASRDAVQRMRATVHEGRSSPARSKLSVAWAASVGLVLVGCVALVATLASDPAATERTGPLAELANSAAAQERSSERILIERRPKRTNSFGAYTEAWSVGDRYYEVNGSELEKDTGRLVPGYAPPRVRSLTPRRPEPYLLRKNSPGWCRCCLTLGRPPSCGRRLLS